MSNDAFDAALRLHFEETPEPADAGFSLRVMAALPPHAPSLEQRRLARWMVRWLRVSHWTAIAVAALGFASLLMNAGPQPDAAHAVAALSLLGLLVFWSIPSRWSRG
jgi:hypothetical protein